MNFSVETLQPGKAKWLGSLAEERPELVKEWAQDLNGDVTPDSVQAGANFVAAWQCERGCKECGRPHEWHTTVANRCSQNHGCPICVGSRVWPCQSLAIKHEALMDEWDYEANTGLDPGSMDCLSNTRVAWRCQHCEHRWEAQVGSRVRQGCGCPSCGRALWRRSYFKRGLLQDERPDIFAEIHPTKNAGVHVFSLTCGSDQELWWLCKRKDGRPEGCLCEHAWKARVVSLCRKKNPTGCPWHSGRAVCLCHSIARLHPDLVDRYWCFELNEGLDTEAIGVASRLKVWWEHLCVNGHMKRQQLTVGSVISRYRYQVSIVLQLADMAAASSVCALDDHLCSYPGPSSRASNGLLGHSIMLSACFDTI